MSTFCCLVKFSSRTRNQPEKYVKNLRSLSQINNVLVLSVKNKCEWDSPTEGSVQNKEVHK